MEASAFHTKLKSYEMSLAAGKENEMDDAELEFAHRYFSWKRVRGGGIKVIPNEEAILAAQKDFGISSSFQIFMRARGTRFVATVAATTLKPRIASQVRP